MTEILSSVETAKITKRQNALGRVRYLQQHNISQGNFVNVPALGIREVAKVSKDARLKYKNPPTGKTTKAWFLPNGVTRIEKLNG